MALTKKPTQSKLTEAETELLIKGGALEPERTSTATPAPKGGRKKKELSSDEEDENISFIQLRLDVEIVANIDRQLKKRIGKVSRHTWFLEAIAEKLQREQSI